MSYLDVVGVEYAEETYAKKIGEYPDLTAGTAEGLIGQSYEVDQSAYNYRKSHDGGRVREQIVGGTVAWNQLEADLHATYTVNGITATNNGDGSITLNGTANDRGTIQVSGTLRSLLAGRVYFLSIKTPLPDGADFTFSGISLGATKSPDHIYKRSSSDASGYIRVQYINGTVFDNVTIYPQIIDLTAMFGSTIADYIYSLEQSSAGAGVAWLKQYIDLDTYHAYNAGSLESVQTDGREVVGFNQWDEEWELGALTADGIKTASTNTIRSANYIRVIPGATYYAKSSAGIWLWGYDENKNYVERVPPGSRVTNTTFVVPSNVRYLMMVEPTNTVYNNNICINLSDPAKNGTYKPYEKYTYPVSNIVLRGISKLVDNQLAFDGDVYAADGTVERRYGIVDLGTLTWRYFSDGTHFRAEMPSDEKAGSLNILTAKYKTASTYGASSIGDGQITVPNAQRSIVIKDSAYTDAATFEAAMSGVYLVYELATPTTETADPYAPVQAVGDTERWIDNRAVPVPVGQNSKYYPDYAEKIDRLPSDFSTLIAPAEASYVATRNYASGDYLIVDNQLYMVTTAIANGGTITPGTNVTATTIMEQIRNILDLI